MITREDIKFMKKSLIFAALVAVCIVTLQVSAQIGSNNNGQQIDTCTDTSTNQSVKVFYDSNRQHYNVVYDDGNTYTTSDVYADSRWDCGDKSTWKTKPEPKPEPKPENEQPSETQTQNTAPSCTE